MTPICILGSRLYQPLTDVTAYIAELPAESEVVGVGISPVSKTAREAADRRGIPSRNILLDPMRKDLLSTARQGKAVVFVCDDKDNHTTEGTAGNIRLLREQGIEIEIVETSVPGKVCEQLTRLRIRVEAFERVAGTRRGDGMRTSCMQGVLAEVTLRRIGLRKKLDTGWDLLRVNDNDNDFRGWERILAVYKVVSAAETDARNRLGIDPVPEIVPDLSPAMIDWAETRREA